MIKAHVAPFYTRKQSEQSHTFDTQSYNYSPCIKSTRGLSVRAHHQHAYKISKDQRAQLSLHCDCIIGTTLTCGKNTAESSTSLTSDKKTVEQCLLNRTIGGKIIRFVDLKRITTKHIDHTTLLANNSRREARHASHAI